LRSAPSAGGYISELAGQKCRVWRGGACFNRDGEPVDVLPYGQSKGDDWVNARGAQAA
jgi:hypothetical protein